jgi:ribosomal protein L11 methyltransferase
MPPSTGCCRRSSPGSAGNNRVALTEIRIEIPADAADAANDVLLEAEDGGWSLLEDALARRAWIVGIFPEEAAARSRWAALRPLLPGAARGEPQLRAVAESDWRDSYKAHFQAWHFGRLHWVPLWERATFALPEGHAALWLDPGMAFGTGNHETTRLCCERLVTRVAADGPPPRVIDAGCGSGILALSAAILGCGEVAAFDNDPEAVRISGENAAMNGLADRVRFSVADLASGLVGRSADLVLANIQADVLVRHVRELVRAVAPGGELVLSGILAAEGRAVQAAFTAAAPGWSSDSRPLGEWCDVVLRRPPG